MKKIKISILIILLFPFFTDAQESFTSKKHEFGISLEANNFSNDLTLGDIASLNSSGFTDIVPQNNPGFGLGVMYRYQLNSFLAGRVQGVISFAENNFLYKTEFANYERKRESVKIEVPVHLVFENKDKKIAPSFFVGGRYSHDLKDEGRSNLGSFRKNDVLLDFGGGIAFKFKLFKFKPELVYSRGVINQAYNEPNTPVDEVFAERFSLRFSFYN